MRAGLDLAPGAHELAGDAAGFVGHGFDFDGCQLPHADVEVDDFGRAPAPVCAPEADGEVHPRQLWELVRVDVHVDAGEADDDEEAVAREEGFVEGVADRGPGLHCDEHEGAGAD